MHTMNLEEVRGGTMAVGSIAQRSDTDESATNQDRDIRWNKFHEELADNLLQSCVTMSASADAFFDGVVMIVGEQYDKRYLRTKTKADRTKALTYFTGTMGCAVLCNIFGRAER